MSWSRRAWARIRAGFARFSHLYEQFFFARYRAAVARERRDHEDLFLMLCFSEVLGIPNPASYYTLELLPVLMERFHDWHRRQGMERSPLEGFR